jgi:hypothetical protein
LLQQLQFPLDAVQHFIAVVRKEIPRSIQEHMASAVAGLGETLSARNKALKNPDGLWATRYCNVMAAAAAAVAAAAGGRGPVRDCVGIYQPWHCSYALARASTQHSWCACHSSTSVCWALGRTGWPITALGSPCWFP